MAVSDRTFGVEIECTYGAPPSGKSDVYQRLNWADRDPMRARAVKEIGAHPDLKRWAKNIGIDGSGIEIRSPILKGEEGLEELAAMFDYLVSIGSTVTNQDGMHVHHGAEDFRKEWPKLYALCKSWGHWTPQIHKLVAHRRRNGSMCRDAFNNAAILKQMEAVCMLNKDDAVEYQKAITQYERAMQRYYNGLVPVRPRLPATLVGRGQRPSHVGGRGALNLGNLERAKGTIEIRLAEGMMDTKSAVAWVKFGQRFLDHTAEEGEVKGKPKTVQTLLSTLKLDEDAAKVLEAKAANKGNALVAAAPGKIADGVNFNDEEDE